MRPPILHLRKRSAFFITLHKCASRFFAEEILPAVRGRSLIDFQRMHYDGCQDLQVAVLTYGHVYGPVRILDPEHPSFALTEQLLRPENFKDKKTVFFVRDPRDILVSMYYSFGFSHPLSPNPQIRDYQVQRRRAIQAMDVDAYALRAAPALRQKFLRILELAGQVEDKLILKYEPLIESFPDFYGRLDAFLGLRRGFRRRIFRLSRPEESEKPGRHKRDGTPGGYINKLRSETRGALDDRLSDVLGAFGYPAL